MLDLDPDGGSDPLGMFPLFLKRAVDVLAPSLIMECFGGLFVWVVYRLAEDWPMSPLFQRVNRPPLLPIT